MPEPTEGPPQSNPESSKPDIPKTGDPKFDQAVQNVLRMVEDQQPDVKEPGRLSKGWGKIKSVLTSQAYPDYPITGEKPPKIEQDLADSLADGIEAEQGVPLNETQKGSLRERLNSALNFKVPLTGKIARDLLIEGVPAAIVGASVKTAVRTGLFALGSTSSLGLSVGIGAAGGAGAAVAKEIIRIKRESVKEDYQKRMAEIREKHQGTRNAFKRELAVRWEAGQIQRVTLAGLRGGATGAVGGAIGFELAGVAWGDVPVIGSLLEKAREVGINLTPKPPTPPSGDLTWDSEGSLIQPVATTPNVPSVPEPPSVAAPSATLNIPPTMYGEGNWSLGQVSTDQVITQPPVVPDASTPQPSFIQSGQGPGPGEPPLETAARPSVAQTAPATVDNSGAGVGPREEEIYRPAVSAGSAPAAMSTPVGETVYEPGAPSTPPVSLSESAIAAGIIPKDGIIPLPEGSNPWNVAKDIGGEALGRPLSDSEVLKLTKALSMDSKISVDDWKISGEGFTHHSSLPPGFKLNFGGPNVTQALNELGSPALKLAA